MEHDARMFDGMLFILGASLPLSHIMFIPHVHLQSTTLIQIAATFTMAAMASGSTQQSMDNDTARCMHCRARSYSSSVMSSSAENLSIHNRLFSSSSLPSMAASFSSEESAGYFSFKSIGLHEPGERTKQERSIEDSLHKVCATPLYAYSTSILTSLIAEWPITHFHDARSRNDTCQTDIFQQVAFPLEDIQCALPIFKALSMFQRQSSKYHGPPIQFTVLLLPTYAHRRILITAETAVPFEHGQGEE